MLGVGVVGINHKTAGLLLREAFAKKAAFLKANPFSPYPTVFLSTCNRVEIYFSASDLAEAHSHILRSLQKQIGVDFEQSLYSFFGVSCFFHLCKVSAGLDSAILLESEIQRQVKLAYAAGMHLNSAMHYVFQKALKVSKEIRYKNSSAPFVSLYHALWKMTCWKNKKILLVGYSEINRGLLSFLKHKKEEKITLCTEDPSRVSSSLFVKDRSCLHQWQDYDILVVAGRSYEPFIQGEGRKNQVIFDLGVPRNVDPNIGALIYNIEQVHDWISRNHHAGSLKENERFIWEKVMSLSHNFQLKSQRVRETAEMGSHL